MRLMRMVLFCSGLFGAAVALQSLSAPTAYGESNGKHAEKGPERRGMMGAEFLERLSGNLKLSEAQKKKVKSIIDESRPEMEKLHAEMKAVADKMKAAMRRTHEAIRETLDTEQKEKFDEISVKMRGLHGGHPHDGPRRAPERAESGKAEAESNNPDD